MTPTALHDGSLPRHKPCCIYTLHHHHHQHHHYHYHQHLHQLSGVIITNIVLLQMGQYAASGGDQLALGIPVGRGRHRISLHQQLPQRTESELLGQWCFAHGGQQHVILADQRSTAIDSSTAVHDRNPVALQHDICMHKQSGVSCCCCS